MNRIKNNIEGHFTLCPNELINQKDLSIQSRFVFVWMASRPDDWIFLHDAAATALGVNLQTFRKYVNELIDAGWITRVRLRNENDGSLMHYLYEVHPSPVTKKPPVVKPLMVNPTDIYKKEETNKDIDIQAPQKIIRYFIEKVAGAYEALPGPETKENIETILQKATPEQLKKVIDQKAAQFHRREIDAKVFNMVWLFKPVNFFNQLAIIERPAQKPKAVNGKNSGIELKGPEAFENINGWQDVK